MPSITCRIGMAAARSAVVLALASAAPAAAQTFPFTSGPIPMCDTSTFTANVSGIGWLITPNGWNWGPYVDNVVLNITTNHPQTLQITLTSPSGTTLLLSAFNGAGGVNYTNTTFPYWGGNNITTASAPFTGFYNPQVGTLDVFSGENADGTWTITVIDTACAGGGTDPSGGPWNPGWFTGGNGTGAFSFGFSSPPPPCTIDMGWPTAAICQGETVDVLGYFEDNWWWDPSSTVNVYIDWGGQTVPDPYAVGASGTYYIEVSDWWNGCTYYGYYNVSVGTAITLGPDQFVAECSGAGPVNLTTYFNTAGATGQAWTLDGVAIPAATAAAATAPGLYELTASNTGCSDVAQVILSFNSDPVLGPDQAVTICQGSSTDLASLFDTGGLLAAWTLDGGPIPPPTAATQAGVYTVSVTTADGCTDVAEAVLDVQPPPALGADQAVGLCSGTTTDLASLFVTTGLTTAWTFNGAPLGNPGAASVDGVYQLVAADANGCADTALVTVTLWPGPALGADEVASTCVGGSIDLTAFYSTVGLAAAWTLGGAAVADPTAVTAAGAYTLTVTDGNGCTDAANVVVSIAANPVLGPDQQVTACDNEAVDLTQLYATGASTPSWTLNGAAVADPTVVTAAGSYQITLTNAAGCSSTALVTVQFNPSPSLGADVEVGICYGTTHDLTSEYNTTGLTTEWWMDGAPFGDPAAADASGGYQLVASNGFGCTDTAMIALVVHDNPDLGPDQSFELCPWHTLDLSTVFPVQGMIASYMLDSLEVADPSAVTDSGAYVVRVTDANGCSDESMANVQPIECLCEADFEAEARCIQEPARFTLLADSTVLSAQWSFGGAADANSQIDPQVMFSAEGEVDVTLIVALSCGVDTLERTITLDDCSDSCSVWIPNAFTPDFDDRNDWWTVVGECEPEEFLIMVFDRWGELIFRSEDPEEKWDGTYAGAVSQDGVYVYRAYYKLPYQGRKSEIGHVTLLR